MTTHHVSPRPPIVLVPGYWLGAWAWNDVVARLTVDGFLAGAITLPGLDSPATPRDDIRFGDHVTAVADSVQRHGEQVVLVAHSGAGAIATAVSDLMPDALSRIVYVDSGPVVHGHIPRPDCAPDDIEIPFPGFDALASQGASSDGLTDATRATVTRLAVPHPAGACREPVTLGNPARNHVPTTVICTSMPSTAIRDMIAHGVPMVAPLAELTDLTWLDLPTGHWPMLSRPSDLAELIASQATTANADARLINR